MDAYRERESNVTCGNTNGVHVSDFDLLFNNPDNLLLLLHVPLDMLSSLPLVTRSVKEEDEFVLDTERCFPLSESFSDNSFSATVARERKTIT